MGALSIWSFRARAYHHSHASTLPSANPLFTWQRRTNFQPNFYQHPVATSENQKSKTAQKTAEGGTDITDEQEVWFVGCHSGELLTLYACGAQINSAQILAGVQPRTQIHILSLTFRCAGWYRRPCGHIVVSCSTTKLSETVASLSPLEKISTLPHRRPPTRQAGVAMALAPGVWLQRIK
jgi:hypothetical protein